MSDQTNDHDLHEQEDRIRRKVDEGERRRDAIADEMEQEMHEKTPWEAVKDDLRAVKDDVKNTLDSEDGDDRDDRDD